MRAITLPVRHPSILFAFTVVFLCFAVQSLNARQNDRPFSLDLNLGGGLIGNSNTNTAFQPELGFSYMPGRWGVGLNAGLYNFDSGFSPDQYRSGFEEYTISEQNEDRWKAFFINAGPRFEQSLNRIVSLELGLDLALNYQRGPSQSVRFNDPTGEMEGAGFDTDIVLAEMNGGDDAGGWNAAIRPQLQLEFKPGFSDRFSFNIKTGIQHHLSNREFTYTERDLSGVRAMDSVYEMHFQFENAPVVQRTESAPKTNFFANAGVKINFGFSKADSKKALEGADDFEPPSTQSPDFDLANSDQNGDCDDGDIDCKPGGRAQDYNAARSNKPTSRAADTGDGDLDSDNDAIETAQDYNSSRSNKPRTEDDRGGDDEIEREATRMAQLIHPTNAIMKTGATSMTAKGKKALGASTVNGENPLHEETVKGENVLYEGQANDGDGDPNDEHQNASTIQKYDLQPGSFCMELSTLKISTNSQQSMRAEAQDYNSSRSNKYNSIADIGDLDGDGFPDVMKTASFSISKRSARTGRNSSTDVDMDGDGYGEADGFYFELEINDPDSDGDGIMDMELESNNPDSGVTFIDLDSDNDGFMNNDPDSDGDGISDEVGRPDVDGDEYGSATRIGQIREKNVTANIVANSTRVLVPAKVSVASATNSVNRGNTSNAVPGQQVAPSQTKVIIMPVSNNGDILPLEELKQRDFDGSVLCWGAGKAQECPGDVSDVVELTTDSPRFTVTSGNDIEWFAVSSGFSRSHSRFADDERELDSYEFVWLVNKDAGNDAGSMNFGTVHIEYSVGGPVIEVEIGDIELQGNLVFMTVELGEEAKTMDGNVCGNTQHLLNGGDCDDEDYGNVRPGRVADTDGDGAPDFRDMDDDGDGIPYFNDPDSDGDGLMDALESATYSISKRSARTGRNSEWQDAPDTDNQLPSDVYQWTYKLSSMAGNEEFPGAGTLTLIYTGGAWHFDVQIDPDDDGDGIGELLQNSSFSISKRSARTGRN